jgi:flagellar L-ring protein precursor FlgH
MVVRGMARAKDVDADNTILSTQLADASIEYYGSGVLADKQKPGWFTRLMDNIWPF